MDHEMNPNSQCNVSELQGSIDSVLKKVEYLSLFLPTWIEFRINTIDYFRVSPKSDFPVSSSRLGKLYSAVASPITGVTSALATVAASITMSVTTFGVLDGYNNAKAEIEQRKFSSAVDYLRRDMRESSCLETVLVDLMEAFNTIKKFPTDHFVDEETGSNYAGKFSDDYDDYFVKWCEKFDMLVNKFLSFLSESMQPCYLIEDLSSRNSQNCINANYIPYWVQSLEKSLPAVRTLKQLTDEIVKSLEEQVRQRQIDETIADDESKNPDTSTSDVPDNRISLDDDWLMIDDPLCNEANRDLPAMDQWSQLIHRLFVYSVRVASDISRLSSEDNLPPLLSKAIYQTKCKPPRRKALLQQQR